MSQISQAMRQGNYVDPLDVFYERSTTRAYLWAIGEYELAEAVDRLQTDAVRDGLVERIGQDAVQTILADAFRPDQTAQLLMVGANAKLTSHLDEVGGAANG